MTDWIYCGEPYINDNPDIFGFVYLITNTRNGKKYIGRKYLTQAGYKQVKGKKKKVRKESDWKSYYGSSPAIKLDLDEFGKDSFSREILRLCRSRGECSYYESKEIFLRDALLDESYYNAWISCRIQASHLKLLVEEYNIEPQT